MQENRIISCVAAELSQQIFSLNLFSVNLAASLSQ